MRNDDKKKLYESLKQEIRSLLISSPKTKCGGLSGSLLYWDYKHLNCGNEIPYAELGFHSLLALLRSMPDVVQIEHQIDSTSYRVHPVYNKQIAHIQKMVQEQRNKYAVNHRLNNENYHHSRTTMQPYQYSSLVNNRLVQDDLYLSHKRAPYLSYQPYSPVRSIDTLPWAHSTPFDINDDSPGVHAMIETPPTFESTECALDEAMPTTTLDTKDAINNSSLVEYQIIPNNNKTNKLQDSIIDQLPESPLTFIVNDSEHFSMKDHLCYDISQYSKQEQFTFSDDIELKKRIYEALRRCIQFRYIHRLYELQFAYRDYPTSNEILVLKFKLEKLALKKYQKELQEFEERIQLNASIDDELCQNMFDEYVYLQRNYYYMTRLMKKKALIK